jgi:hypothetical protein
MGDEERDRRDIDMVRRVAAEFVGALTESSHGDHFAAGGHGTFFRILTRSPPRFPSPPENSGPLLDRLTQRIGAFQGLDRPSLDPKQHLELQGQLTSAAHLITFAKQTDLGGVPVFTGIENVYGAPALFDVFNPSARIGITPGMGAFREINFNDRRNWPELTRWIRDAAGRSRNIAIIEPQAATSAYLTLFLDTLRAATRAVAAPTTYKFTVHSTKSDYSLESYPQFNYSPVGFGGSKTTTPVEGSLPCGHHCFRGWLNGEVTDDPGVYYVGPGSDSARLKAF